MSRSPTTLTQIKGNNMNEKNFVTAEKFSQWMGSDSLNVQELTKLLLEVINGHYPVQVLREDIASYENN